MLHRFYKLKDDWVLPAMRENTLKLSSPATFNDPFDCQLSPDSYGLGEAQAMRFIMSGAKELDRVAWDGLFSRGHSMLLESSASMLVRLLLLSRLGVCCFSEEEDSVLMWSHYTGGFRGFCVTYHVRREDVQQLGDDIVLQEVNYASIYPRVSARALLAYYGPVEAGRAISSLVLTKSVDWAYEREWRLVTLGGEKVISNPFSIMKVALGCRLTSRERLDVISAFTDSENIAFNYAVPDADRFRLRTLPTDHEGNVTHGGSGLFMIYG